MAATIRDIRDRTGLSLATISKYLNGGNVLPENKLRIEAAIKELNYEVNELARGLVTNKTKTVGVVVYSVESLFNGTLLHYIADQLRKNGYGLLICDSGFDKEIEAKNIKFLLSKKVDGIIVIPVANTSTFLNPAKNAGVPVVLLDRALQDSVQDCVRIDNRMAAFRAVNLLVENRHKRIAVICSQEEYTGRERYKGFMDAMEQAGIEIPESYQKKGRHSIEFGYASMKQLLEMKTPPTGVFLGNYDITLGAVMAVNESDFSCPKDISLLGFDDLLLSHVVKPRMYMVVQPMQEMGEKTVDLLLNRIEGREKGMPVEIVLGTRIQEGNSIMRLKR